MLPISRLPHAEDPIQKMHLLPAVAVAVITCCEFMFLHT